MEVKVIHQKGEREYQEDSYYVDPQHRFFIVCDGVGGGEKGKLASFTVTEAARDWIKRHYDAITQNTRWEDLADHMSQSLANESNQHSLEKPMGSTAVIAIRKDDSIHILHIGDSRCYHIRPAEDYYWRTKDHSLVQELFDTGVLNTQEEMDTHPKRNVITRAFTSEAKEETPYLDYTFISTIKVNDIFILCSDGVLEAFPGDSIVDAFLNKESKFKGVVDDIGDQCEREAKDNCTIIAVKVQLI